MDGCAKALMGFHMIPNASGRKLAELSLSGLYRRRTLLTVAAVCLFTTTLSLRSNAITIISHVEDLPDVVAGQDLQKFIYEVSGFDFAPNQGFSIFFDPTLYSDLEAAPAAPNADWDVLTLQPIPLLSEPGIYDALSIV